MRPRLMTLVVALALAGGCSSSEPTALEVAKSHVVQAQWALGLAASDEAIRIAPSDHRGHLLRGRANLGLKNFPAAIDDLTTAIQLAPKACEPYFQRSLAYQASGQPVLSASDLETARSLDLEFSITFAYAAIPAYVIDEPRQDDNTKTLAVRSTDDSAPAQGPNNGLLSWAAAGISPLDDPTNPFVSPEKQPPATIVVAPKAAGGLGLLPEARPSPDQFFNDPSFRFRPENHTANRRRSHDLTGLTTDLSGIQPRRKIAFHRGGTHPATNSPAAAYNPSTIYNSPTMLRKSKYPIARWQASGIQASGIQASGITASGDRPMGPTQTSPAGLSRRGTSRFEMPRSEISRFEMPRRGGPSGISSGNMTDTRRSKFKPVVVLPQSLPQTGSYQPGNFPQR